MNDGNSVGILEGDEVGPLVGTTEGTLEGKLEGKRVLG